MSTTTETASRNKRSRFGDDNAIDNGATSGGSANINVPPKLKQLIGTRLEPIIEPLATLPLELQTHIITELNVMLDLHASIEQRRTTNARFEKPATNPTTGEELVDDEGKPLEFVPNSIRSKPPVKPSTLTQDDAEMQALVEEAAAAHEKAKLEQAGFAKQVSKLEIKLREKELRRLLYELANKLTIGYVCTKEVKRKSIEDLSLSRRELVSLSCHAAIGRFNLQDAEYLGFRAIPVLGSVENEGTPLVTAQQNLATDFATTMKINVNALKNKAGINIVDPAPKDKVFIDEVVADMGSIIQDLTLKVMRIVDEKEELCKINALLRQELKPDAILDATEEVDQAMDQQDAAAPSKQLEDLIKKLQKEGIEKLGRKLSKDLRKKYSGDNKTQSSTPTSHGQRQNKTSNGSSKSTNKNKKNGKSASKHSKKKKDAPQPTKNTTKKSTAAKGKKSRGNRGGASKGRRGRSSGRS